MQWNCLHIPHYSQTVTYCQYIPWPLSFLCGQLLCVAIQLGIVERVVVSIVGFLEISISHFELFNFSLILQAASKSGELELLNIREEITSKTCLQLESVTLIFLSPSLSCSKIAVAKTSQIS